jgi:hypothetical protein
MDVGTWEEAAGKRSGKLFFPLSAAALNPVLSFIWSPRTSSPVVAPAGPARQAELEPSLHAQEPPGSLCFDIRQVVKMISHACLQPPYLIAFI